MTAERPNLIEAGIQAYVGLRVGYSEKAFTSGMIPRKRECLQRRGKIVLVEFWDEDTLEALSEFREGCTTVIQIDWEDGKNHLHGKGLYFPVEKVSALPDDEPERPFVPTHPDRPRTESADLPTTNLYIGMQVRPEPLSAYQRKKLVRAAIKSLMGTLTSLQRQGYTKRRPNETILPEHNKKQIRDYLYVIDNAYEVEVVGINCVGHHVGMRVVNQCYIGGGPSTSGVHYYGQLLWRAINADGNHVCVMQSEDTLKYTFSEHDLMKREIKLPTVG